MIRALTRSPLAQAAIVFAAAFAVYANSIGNGFVYDDNDIILGNEWIRDFSHIYQVFTMNIGAYKDWETSNFYRPVAQIILMVQYRLFGYDPLGWHLSYVLLHAFVSTLLLVIFRALFAKWSVAAKDSMALMAALLFATHPVHTEVVAWNGAHEMVFTTATLLCLYFHMKGRLAPALTAFVFAAFTKETAVIIPVVLLAYDYSFERGIFHETQPGRTRLLLKRYLPYIVAVAAFMTLRTIAIKGFAPVNNHPELTLYLFALNILSLFTDYLAMLALPINLTPTHIFNPVMGALEPKALISFAVAASFLGAAFYVRNRQPLILFSLALIALPLLPVLYIPAFAAHVFAERYLYIPSIGFIIIVLVCIQKLTLLVPWTKQRAPAALVAAFFVLTTAYTVGTVKRNPAWKDDYSLWTEAVKLPPVSFVAWNNLGLANFKKGNHKEAEENYKMSLSVMPLYAKARYNLGILYHTKGLTTEAISEYIRAVELDPTFTNAYYNMGIIYQNVGRLDAAEAALEKVVSIKPDHGEAHSRLGRVYFDTGKATAALIHYGRVVELDPASAYAHIDFGGALAALDRWDEAAVEFAEAVRLDPALDDALFNLSLAYMNIGNEEKALAAMEEYITKHPGDADATAILIMLKSDGDDTGGAGTGG